MNPFLHVATFLVSEASLLLGVTRLRRGPVPLERVVTECGPNVREYVPRGRAETQPILVFVHGGGWHAGTIDEAVWWWQNVSYAPLGELLASRGAHVALVGYPLCYTSPRYRYGFYVALALFAVFMAWLLARLTPLAFVHWAVLAVIGWIFVSLLVRSRMMPASQTRGTDVTRQYHVVEQAVVDLMNHYPRATIVLVGHSAGAHLAALVARSPRAGVAKRITHFFGLAGVYRPERLLERFHPVLRPLVSGFFPQEFVTGSADELQSLSPHALLERDGVLASQRWTIITSQGEPPMLIEQADDLFTLIRNASPPSAVRLADVGLGHGRGLVYAEQAWQHILPSVVPARD